MMEDHGDRGVRAPAPANKTNATSGKEKPSELEVLRFRVEEQSELIMLYKQRNEECSKKIAHYKHVEEELLAKSEKALRELEALRDKFNTLSANHQEIVKFKDEYKGQNKTLRERNKVLEDAVTTLEQSSSTKMEDAKRQLKSIIAEQTLQISQLKEKNSALSREVDEKTATYNKEVAALQKANATLQKTVRDLSVKSRHTEELMVAKMGDCNARIAALEQENKKAHTALKESQGEESRLRERAEMAEKETKRLKNALEANSVNTKVREAVERMEEAEEEMERLREEYDAFKLRSTQQLQKEKELSARLRKLMSGT